MKLAVGKGKPDTLAAIIAGSTRATASPVRPATACGPASTEPATGTCPWDGPYSNWSVTMRLAVGPLCEAPRLTFIVVITATATLARTGAGGRPRIAGTLALGLPGSRRAAISVAARLV